MSDPLLLTFNPGSSTIKFGLFRVTNQEPVRIGDGKIDFRCNPLELVLSHDGETIRIPLNAPVTEDLHEVLDEILNEFAGHYSLKDCVSAGHRVVH
jgi:acetate kinase